MAFTALCAILSEVPIVRYTVIWGTTEKEKKMMAINDDNASIIRCILEMIKCVGKCVS